MDVKSLIQNTLSESKYDLWVVMLYTNANSACQSGTERQRLRQETEDEGEGRLFREKIKTFLNVILHHVRDDSGFSRPNVGRYVFKPWTSDFKGPPSTTELSGGPLGEELHVEVLTQSKE